MNSSDLIINTQKIDELYAEINQMIELAIKETDYQKPSYQTLCTAQKNLTDMKIYLNELQTSLTKKHEFINQVKHDLLLLLLSGIGTFIGVFSTFHFLKLS